MAWRACLACWYSESCSDSVVIGLCGDILFQKESEVQTLYKQDGNLWRGRSMGNNEVMVSCFGAMEMGREIPLLPSLRPCLSFLCSLGVASLVGLADCLLFVPLAVITSPHSIHFGCPSAVTGLDL